MYSCCKIEPLYRVLLFHLRLFLFMLKVVYNRGFRVLALTGRFFLAFVVSVLCFRLTYGCRVPRFERERTCPLCRALVKPADLRSFGDGSTSLFIQLF